MTACGHTGMRVHAISPLSSGAALACLMLELVEAVVIATCSGASQPGLQQVVDLRVEYEMLDASAHTLRGRQAACSAPRAVRLVKASSLRARRGTNPHILTFHPNPTQIMLSGAPVRPGWSRRACWTSGTRGALRWSAPGRSCWATAAT